MILRTTQAEAREFVPYKEINLFKRLLYFSRLQGNQSMNEVQLLKMALEEKEQALLSSQETVQV